MVIFTAILASGFYGYKVYSDIKRTSTYVYKEVETEKVRKKPVALKKGEPFSVLLLGVDTGDEGRLDQGRSDSIMLLTINPRENKTKMVSIPRDTYTDIEGHGLDKINHAYAFGGVSLSINTIQKMFNLPIDYYVEVDMKGLKELVDILGGVSVENRLDFCYGTTHFSIGKQQLDGESALKYTRMRYDDPKGDYGRQERQRKVVEAMIKKGASFSTLMKYQDILKTLENNLQTNFTFEGIYNMQLKYKQSVANVEQVQLKGAGAMIDGVSYQIIDRAELVKVSEMLRKELL